jgi:hypothetical protein
MRHSALAQTLFPLACVIRALSREVRFSLGTCSKSFKQKHQESPVHELQARPCAARLSGAGCANLIAAAETRQGRFIAVTEARDPPKIELETLRLAHECLLA